MKQYIAYEWVKNMLIDILKKEIDNLKYQIISYEKYEEKGTKEYVESCKMKLDDLNYYLDKVEEL